LSFTNKEIADNLRAKALELFESPKANTLSIGRLIPYDMGINSITYQHLAEVALDDFTDFLFANKDIKVLFLLMVAESLETN
jgi:3'-phosphoadenosine 5'-phosphosulfate sulfotransferase (PAPS reductase)/FAD synthetase